MKARYFQFVIGLLLLLTLVAGGSFWFKKSRPPQFSATMTGGQTLVLRGVDFGKKHPPPGKLRMLAGLRQFGLVPEKWVDARSFSADENAALCCWVEEPLPRTLDYHLVLVDAQENEVTALEMLGSVVYQGHETRGLGFPIWPRDGRPLRCRFYQYSGNPRQRFLGEFALPTKLPILPPPGPISTNATSGDLQATLTDFIAQVQDNTTNAAPTNHLMAKSLLALTFSRNGQPWPGWRVSRGQILDAQSNILTRIGPLLPTRMERGMGYSSGLEISAARSSGAGSIFWMAGMWPNHPPLRIQVGVRQTIWDEIAPDERWLLRGEDLRRNRTFTTNIQNHTLRFSHYNVRQSFGSTYTYLEFTSEPGAPDWELFPVRGFKGIAPDNVEWTDERAHSRSDSLERTTWELVVYRTNGPQADLYLGFQKLRRLEFIAPARSL